MSTFTEFNGPNQGQYDPAYLLNIIRDEVNTIVGKLSNLNTEDKSAIVPAMNEILKDLNDYIDSWENPSDPEVVKVIQCLTKFKSIITHSLTIDNGSFNFKNWKEVQAQYNTNVFIVACLNDLGINGNSLSLTCPSTIYLKTVGVTPFNAIIHIAPTYSNNECYAAIDAITSKAPGTFNNLKYHIVKCIDNSGHERFYLALSADGLSQPGQMATFRVAGTNVIPLCNEPEYYKYKPTGTNVNVVTLEVGDNTTSFAMNTLVLEELTTNVIKDKSNGNNKIIESKEVHYIDDSGIEQDSQDIVIGSEGIHKIHCFKRPVVTLSTPSEEDPHMVTVSELVTAYDLQNVLIPIGSMFKYPTETTLEAANTPIDPPPLFLWCNGTIKPAEDYPELAALLGTSLNSFTLPNEPGFIIKAKFYNIIEAAANPEFNDLSLQHLSNRITAEATTRANADEHLQQHLSNRITAEATTRANADEHLQQQIDTVGDWHEPLAAEAEARETEDLALANADTQIRTDTSAQYLNLQNQVSGYHPDNTTGDDTPTDPDTSTDPNTPENPEVQP